MTAYADRVARAPKTLSEREQRLLLAVTGQRRDGIRDHVLLSLALGTGPPAHQRPAPDLGAPLHAGRPPHLAPPPPPPPTTHPPAPHGPHIDHTIGINGTAIITGQAIKVRR